MKYTTVLPLLLFLLFAACSHNETLSRERAPASVSGSQGQGRPLWENNICVLKGQNREQDYIVRFSDIHSFCPPLRDYNPAGQAYSKLKSTGKGVHLPACQPQPVQSRNVASKCWMGFDVFGNSAGSCTLNPSQSSCSSCHCGNQNGIAWQ